MRYLKNNHYCTNIGCNYTTGIANENEDDADNKLHSDGGMNVKDSTSCPQCNKDSLIFLPK